MFCRIFVVEYSYRAIGNTTCVFAGIVNRRSKHKVTVRRAKNNIIVSGVKSCLR